MDINAPAHGKYFDGKSARQMPVNVHMDTRHNTARFGDPTCRVRRDYLALGRAARSGPELWPGLRGSC